MNPLTKHLLLIACGSVAMLLIDGCVVRLRQVAINYQPEPNIVPIAGASEVPVKLEVVDARVLRDRIGQVDVLGPAAVVAVNDPVLVLKQAFEDELTHRGFKLSDSGNEIVVQLNSIYCNFYTPPEPHGALASVAITVRIRKSNGPVIYYNLLTGEADDPKVLDKANAGPTLDKALQNCLARLFADPSFLNALLNSSRITAAHPDGPG